MASLLETELALEGLVYVMENISRGFPVKANALDVDRLEDEQFF